MTRPDLTAARELLAALDGTHLAAVIHGVNTRALADDLRALLAVWDATPHEGDRYEGTTTDNFRGVWTVVATGGSDGPRSDVLTLRGDDGHSRKASAAWLADMVADGTLRRLP